MNELLQTAPKQVMRVPPSVPGRSLQFDLFTSFLGSNQSDFSNTIELWDAIPKYFITPRQQAKMRDEKGRLPVYEHEFYYRPSSKQKREPIPCKVILRPALINVDGKYIDFYPSTNEELVEEVLRKFLSDQQYGFHDVKQNESWVQFTLHMIRKELADRNKSRSLEEVKRSLDIMNASNIETIFGGKDGGVAYSGNILSDLTRVTRKHYKEDPKAKWCARLPALISKSVNELSYRQFDYEAHMQLKGPLARWMRKQLCHKYTNAALDQPFNILYSTVQRDSGFLTHPRTTANIKTLESVFEEFKQVKVLYGFHAETKHEGRKIADVRYTLIPHSDFISEVKAANKRYSNNEITLATAR